MPFHLLVCGRQPCWRRPLTSSTMPGTLQRTLATRYEVHLCATQRSVFQDFYFVFLPAALSSNTYLAGTDRHTAPMTGKCVISQADVLFRLQSIPGTDQTCFKHQIRQIVSRDASVPTMLVSCPCSQEGRGCCPRRQVQSQLMPRHFQSFYPSIIPR